MQQTILFLLLNAFTLCLQIPFRTQKDLDCFFNYTINRPFDIFEIQNHTWYLQAQYYDDLDLALYYNNTNFRFGYFEANDYDTRKYISIEANYHIGNLYKINLSGEKYPYIYNRLYLFKNATNGEFKTFNTLDEFPQQFRILENYGNWMIISSCTYSLSSLKVFLVSQQPVINENDLQLAEVRIRDFKLRFERFYPEYYYVYPLQLPKLLGQGIN